VPKKRRRTSAFGMKETVVLFVKELQMHLPEPMLMLVVAEKEKPGEKDVEKEERNLVKSAKEKHAENYENAKRKLKEEDVVKIFHSAML
jgi:hypothetical protein